LQPEIETERGQSARRISPQKRTTKRHAAEPEDRGQQARRSGAWGERASDAKAGAPIKAEKIEAAINR